MFQMTTVALQAHLKQNLTFLGSLRQNLSPHSHRQDILQSVSCQIWVLLTSCWGCLLIPWLEICVSNGKFGGCECCERFCRKEPEKVKFCFKCACSARWSFGTCALIKLSFKLETSNLQFFYCYRICFQEM